MKKSIRRQRKKTKSFDAERLHEVLGLLLAAIGLLTLLALITYQGEPEFGGNLLGSLGAYLSCYLVQFIGRFPAYVFPLLLFLWSASVFFSWKKLRTLLHSAYLFLAAFWISFTISLFEVKDPISEHAGWIGVVFGSLLRRLIGEVGSWILWTLVVLIALVLFLRLKPSEIIKQSGIWLKAVSKWLWDHRPKKAPKFRIRRSKVQDVHTAPPDLEDQGESKQEALPTDEDLFTIAEAHKPAEKANGQIVEVKKDTREYQLPPLSLLDDPQPESPDAPEELKAKAKRLQEALFDFGVGAKVVRVNPGPVITRFDLEPDPGVKVNRISNLADDLALVLRARAIRIQAPIPGQGAVGIEIPNRKPSIVSLKGVAQDPSFSDLSSPLSLALGSTASGRPYISDLSKMPHLLVAGTTGSGKSVCLNAIIASLLMRNPPARLQFVIIDPKKLELSIYARLARHHLLTTDDLDEEVITTPANAVRIFGGVELEMARRYDMLAAAGVRNIEEFNQLADEGKAVTLEGEKLNPLSYLVVVVDELADLMLIAAKEVEEPIARLAQMARAVGIHLIVATQRPSVDVITGVIKANFPARLAFQVASKTDSRTILDCNGAEALLGNGDALFIPPGRGQPERIHCCFIGHKEIEKIVSFIEDQPHDFFRSPLVIPKPEGIMMGNGELNGDRDEFFDDAARMVVHQGQASVSILQRRLKIGYARAGRLIDQLERAGIVGPFDGSKAREVLVDENELNSMTGDTPPPL